MAKRWLGRMVNTQRRITAKERECIHSGLAKGKRGAELARDLGRDASVINRDITRNHGRKGYSGVDARALARRRPSQTVRNKIADNAALGQEVLTLFETGATPKHIEVALRRRHHSTPSRYVRWTHSSGQGNRES